jgi:hypothetical protein
MTGGPKSRLLQQSDAVAWVQHLLNDEDISDRLSIGWSARSTEPVLNSGVSGGSKSNFNIPRRGNDGLCVAQQQGSTPGRGFNCQTQRSACIRPLWTASVPDAVVGVSVVEPLTRKVGPSSKTMIKIIERVGTSDRTAVLAQADGVAIVAVFRPLVRGTEASQLVPRH